MIIFGNSGMWVMELGRLLAFRNTTSFVSLLMLKLGFFFISFAAVVVNKHFFADKFLHITYYFDGVFLLKE